MKRTTRAGKLNKPIGHIWGARWGNVPAKFVKAKVVSIIVGDHPAADYWARDYVGHQRRAIEMTILNRDGSVYERFWLDDHKGEAVYNLTVGGGKPEGFKLVQPAKYADDDTIAISYGFKTQD